ncbi:MAG: nucleotide exchange factor GrpE [Clostridiales bacterium]|nr:nucleotide exchange factor GrpE [Clostridiales bacterium]
MREEANESATGGETVSNASADETKNQAGEQDCRKEAPDSTKSAADSSAKDGDTAEEESYSQKNAASGETAAGNQTDASAGTGSSEEDSEKKGFFGRKKKEKDKRDQQIEELTDRVQRQMAEFDNFRKRSEKEKSAMFEVGAKSVLEKILPTVDNFERGFANMSEEQKQDAFAQGMEKVYRQLLSVLDGIGVKPIEAVGQPFDPNFHNAVMHVEDEESGENIVVEEFQKGYLYHDSVLRHSMVKVAN